MGLVNLITRVYQIVFLELTCSRGFYLLIPSNIIILYNNILIQQINHNYTNQLYRMSGMYMILYLFCVLTVWCVIDGHSLQNPCWPTEARTIVCVKRTVHVTATRACQVKVYCWSHTQHSMGNWWNFYVISSRTVNYPLTHLICLDLLVKQKHAKMKRAVETCTWCILNSYQSMINANHCQKQ